MGEFGATFARPFSGALLPKHWILVCAIVRPVGSHSGTSPGAAVCSWGPGSVSEFALEPDMPAGTMAENTTEKFTFRLLRMATQARLRRGNNLPGAIS